MVTRNFQLFFYITILIGIREILSRWDHYNWGKFSRVGGELIVWRYLLTKVRHWNGVYLPCSDLQYRRTSVSHCYFMWLGVHLWWFLDTSLIVLRGSISDTRFISLQNLKKAPNINNNKKSKEKVSLNVLHFWGEASISCGNTESMIYPGIKPRQKMNTVICF